MDHPDLTVSNFMGNPIDTEKVNGNNLQADDSHVISSLIITKNAEIYQNVCGLQQS